MSKSTQTTENSDETTLDNARSRCGQTIDFAFRNPEPVLVDALPAMGKSSGVIRWAAETGNPVTVLTARRGLYKEYTEWCDEAGLTCHTLPSFHSDCSTASGDSGKKWATRVIDEYESRQKNGRWIHDNAREIFDEELPCQHEDECPYLTAHDFDPDEFDVLVGHYLHGHVEQRIAGRYVAIDEFPEGDFETTYKSSVVYSAVSAYFQQEDGIPFRYAKEIASCRDPTRIQQAIEWLQDKNPQLTVDRDSDKKSKETIHIDAARMAYVLLASEDLENGWSHVRMLEGQIGVQNPNSNSVTLVQPPGFRTAASVIALDGTPTVELWRSILGDTMEHRQVLTDEERAEYLRDCLNLNIIQTTQEVKPYNSGEYVTPPSDRALLGAIEQREGARPALITSKKAKKQYDEAGASIHVDKTAHYYDIKGMNDFATVRLGIVIGSPDPGHERLQRWAALSGRSIEQNGERGWKKTYGDFGDRLLRGKRENEVLQAIMRFGRVERNGDRGATVYVHTGALPEWVPVSHQPANVHLWDNGKTSGMSKVLAAISSRKEWTTSDIAKESVTTITRRQVLRNLKTLKEYGYIGGEKTGSGWQWWNIRVDEAIPYGQVEFEV